MESGFTEYVLVDQGLSEAYATTLERALRGLMAAGVRLPRRGDSAEQARAGVRGFLAAKKLQGHVHAVRLYQKALRHYVAFLGLRERGQAMGWSLEEAPRRGLSPYTAAEVRAILASVRPGFKGLRQQAILFLLAHTGLRKREVFSLDVDDFDRDRGAVRLRHPRKRGVVRWVNLPDKAWEPTSRFQAYLAARLGASGALWVTEDGTALSLAGFSHDLYELRQRSGVPLNFNRWRHSRGLVARVLDVPVEVQAGEWGHGDWRSTQHYLHSDQDNRRATLERHGMPGYLRRDRAQELVDAIADV